MTIATGDGPSQAASLRPKKARAQTRSHARLLASCGAFALALALAPAPAQAKKLLLTCQDAKHKYQITYDTLARTLATTHREFRSLDVERLQENEDGVLVWGAMRLGAATRNILVNFGKQKWVRHFRGYDETWTDACI
jgi:hypothetical protein